MTAPPPVLWHYTCLHALEPIRAERVLRPNPHPWLPRPLVWLTDQADPDRAGLGLTSELLRCDRLDVAVLVEAPAAWWPDYRQQLRPRLPARIVRALEAAPARPASWWVSEHALPVVDVVERAPW